MELKLEGEALNQLIEGAIIKALGETGQQALIKNVVSYLTTSRSGYASDKDSPLLKALHAAASDSAAKYFRDKLQNDPTFVNELEKLFTDATKKFFDSETREKTIDRIVDRLSSAFGDRY